jgi:Tol biopolymer transport system component
MDTDGSHIRRLLPGIHAGFARWSPDGSRLAFVGGAIPDTQIYVATAEGLHPLQVTR